MSSQPKVLVFGAGAVGTIYIYLLQQAGCAVTAVCRSNYEAAKCKLHPYPPLPFRSSPPPIPTITIMESVHQVPTGPNSPTLMPYSSKRLPHRLQEIRQWHTHPPTRRARLHRSPHQRGRVRLYPRNRKSVPGRLAECCRTHPSCCGEGYGDSATAEWDWDRG